MSISIATHGKYGWSQWSIGGSTGGGGGEVERKKPVVRVSGVKYDRYKDKKINITVKDINYD